MTFAERLRQLRDARGLSEAKLAEASGLPVATVHNYSLGRRKPSFAAVVKLARALGADCTAFADCADVVGADDSPPAKAPAKPPARPRGKGKR